MKNKTYPDFVAKSGQVNTPPGSYDTVKEWIREGFIGRNSNVLEIGCTTGFISYQINKYTNANVTGIDLSAEAIKKARKNCEGILEIEFKRGNAKELSFQDNYFSHVIIGGHLPWVSKDERPIHVSEAIRVLKNDGFLLTCLYYFRDKPSIELLDEFNSTFDMQLSADEDYRYWSSLFNLENLVLENENNYKIICPNELRKKKYVARFDEKFKDEWQHKVELFSQNGKYLNFFVKVFQKVNESNSFTQIPRGGIYQWKKIS